MIILTTFHNMIIYTNNVSCILENIQYGLYQNSIKTRNEPCPWRYTVLILKCNASYLIIVATSLFMKPVCFGN